MILNQLEGILKSKENDRLVYTDTPLLENTVNGTQLSGIHAFTNVNGNVYGNVYGRIRRNSQKTVISVNGQKALENIGKILVKAELLIQLSSHAEKVNISLSHDVSAVRGSVTLLNFV